MIYFDCGGLCIRDFEEGDIAPIVAGECAQGWHSTDEKYIMRIADRAAGKCVCLCAVLHGEPVGYINVYFTAENGPFKGTGLPEIVDFGVLERVRCRGIGAHLMDAAEAIAAQVADTVTIGVGLHSGYGSAQRMYVKRGYIPDGSGVWYRDALCTPYGACQNDDDLVLHLSKTL